MACDWDGTLPFYTDHGGMQQDRTIRHCIWEGIIVNTTKWAIYGNTSTASMYYSYCQYQYYCHELLLNCCIYISLLLLS